jgi:hypothetical protein
MDRWNLKKKEILEISTKGRPRSSGAAYHHDSYRCETSVQSRKATIAQSNSWWRRDEVRHLVALRGQAGGRTSRRERLLRRSYSVDALRLRNYIWPHFLRRDGQRRALSRPETHGLPGERCRHHEMFESIEEQQMLCCVAVSQE